MRLIVRRWLKATDEHGLTTNGLSPQQETLVRELLSGYDESSYRLRLTLTQRFGYGEPAHLEIASGAEGTCTRLGVTTAEVERELEKLPDLLKLHSQHPQSRFKLKRKDGLQP